MSPLRRARRIAAIAILVSALPVSVSYLSAVTGPSNSSFVIRSFEWLRSAGAATFASQVEDLYYSLNAPPTGGPALQRIPLARRRAMAAAVHPPDVVPLIAPALPGEGVWLPSEHWSADSPVQITQFRSDPNYPQMLAGVAWINTARVSITLNPGMLEPDVSLPRGAEMVPTDLRSRLLATFNSGFKLEDDNGGFALAGQTYAPLRRGQATIVGYRDGRVDVVSWTGGAEAPAGVQWARQNLPLIVDEGAPNPQLGDGALWGATVDNAVRVWRSGVGVDAHGNLIYAAADDQTAQSLAEILIHAGAVRAMELDINSYWDSFISYAASGAGSPSNLLPDMVRSPYRYLTPDDRDFFAVYLR